MSRPYYDEHGIHREPDDAEMLEIIRKALHPGESNGPQSGRETFPVPRETSTVKHSNPKKDSIND